ncbi:MAG: response regulator [Elusimicrobiota bacterium]
MARILIVDDEDSVRCLLEDMLKGKGYALDLAHDGASAFELLRDNKFDLAIIDLTMPVMNGVELVQLIRKNPKMLTMKILLCTGAEVPESVNKAAAAGVDDYIIKPFDSKTLLAKVAKLTPPSTR